MAILTGYAAIISWLGADHTYVLSSDGHSWPCWGSSTGGNAICSGEGSSSVANCISQPNSWAGIIYGVTGVCHQTADRILFPARVIVSRARDFWLSSILYGVYGTDLIEWGAKAGACYLFGGGPGGPHPIPNLALANAASAEGKKSAPQQDKSEKDFLEKIIALYSDTSQAPETLLGNELELMIDYRLGAEFDSDKTKEILSLHKDLLKKKHEVDLALYKKDLNGEKYAAEVNNLFSEVLKSKAEILGDEDYEKLFGMKPGKSVTIVDPKIAAEVHK